MSNNKHLLVTGNVVGGIVNPGGDIWGGENEGDVGYPPPIIFEG